MVPILICGLTRLYAVENEREKFVGEIKSLSFPTVYKRGSVVESTSLDYEFFMSIIAAAGDCVSNFLFQHVKANKITLTILSEITYRSDDLIDIQNITDLHSTKSPKFAPSRESFGVLRF